MFLAHLGYASNTSIVLCFVLIMFSTCLVKLATVDAFVFKKNAIEIKTHKKKHDGQCVNSRLLLVMLETDEDIKAVFKLIGRFGENVLRH